MMLVDEEIDLLLQNNEVRLALQQNNELDQPDETGLVSCLHRCQSEEAKKLCIYDLNKKLIHSSDYDIGGTYTGNEPDLWFYFSTTLCPGYNYLVNLFVCHRKVGNFSIGISHTRDTITADRSNKDSGTEWLALSRSLKWYYFKSAQPNEIYHIKTFCFREDEVNLLEQNTYKIPIKIVMNSSHCLNDDVIMSIKLQHDLSELLSKKEKTDYVLISASGKEFPAHKIILIAHCPILRNLVKESKNNSVFIDIGDSDMELLLQFLYTGTIKDMTKQDCMNLLKIASRFQLQNLFLLAEYAIGEQISVESAVDIALISKKHRMGKLQSKVFSFIRNNPKVMQTESWKALKDVELTKQLIEHIYTGSSSIPIEGSI